MEDKKYKRVAENATLFCMKNYIREEETVIQDDLWERLENYLDRYIPEYLLYRFMHGEQKLNSNTAEKLMYQRKMWSV